MCVYSLHIIIVHYTERIVKCNEKHLWSPAIYRCHCQLLFCYLHKNEYEKILVKQHHLITLDTNDIKYPWCMKK